MIITKKVEVKIIPKTIKYYKNLGYECEINQLTTIDIKHLSKGSHLKIKVKCSQCNKIKELSYKNYLKNIKKHNIYTCAGKCSIIKNTITNLEKYGTEYVFQNKNIIKKSKQTKIKKYNDENFNNRDKSKKTMLEKYGVEHISQLKETDQKSKKTMLEKYGVDHIMKIPYIVEKSKKKRQETIKRNSLDKFKRIENQKETFEKHGYQLLDIINNDILLKSIKCEHVFQINKSTFFSRLNYGTNICLTCNDKNSNNSNLENYLVNFLKENYHNETIKNNRTILEGKELDIYIPELNLAIEFNGLYWHSELYKDKNYHLEKTLKCKEKGIDLIHIFEDDWINKRPIIESILLNKINKISNKIYARKCIIKEVSAKDSRIFLNDNHIQGFSRSKYKLGLYHNDELVSLMTFGYRKTNRKKEFELIRFCNKLNTSVIGSASKLFKYFIKNYRDKIKEGYILSYADISMFNGDLYNRLGFNYIHRSKPNYFWVVDRQREHRWKYNKQNLIKEGFDGSMTESEIMHQRGHYRIYGCGQDRYEYSII